MTRFLLLPACCALTLLVSGQNGFRVGYDVFFETLCPAANGDLLITHDSHTGIVPPYTVMRSDSLGSVLWARNFWTVEQLPDMVETAGQEILVAANWTDSATQLQCPALMKLASDGTLLWAEYFMCDTVPVRVRSLVRTTNGANIMTVCAFNGKLKALIKLNDNGQVLWVRKLSQDWNYQFDLVVPVENGAVLVLDGRSFYNAVMKISSSGQLLWMNEYDLNGSWISKWFDGVQMPNGDYRFLLRSLDFATDGHVLMVATDAAGALLNNTTYTFPDNENILYADMEVNGLGQLVMAMHHGNGHEILLLTDAAGAVQSVQKAIALQIYGGDVEFLDDQHFATMSSCNVPGSSSILFRSDAALGINDCFEPYGASVSTTAVSITPLSYTLIAPTVMVVPFTPVNSPVAIGISLPCSSVGFEPELDPSIAPYPDPVMDRLIVPLPSTFNGEAHFVVFNALGACVRAQLLPADGAVDVASLSPGLYVIHLFNTDRRSLGHASFIKE